MADRVGASKAAITEVYLRAEEEAMQKDADSYKSGGTNCTCCRDALPLIAEIRRLRQGLFECFRWAGGDTDGDDDPEAWMGDIVHRVVPLVIELRHDYDEALERLP